MGGLAIVNGFLNVPLRNLDFCEGISTLYIRK